MTRHFSIEYMRADQWAMSHGDDWRPQPDDPSVDHTDRDAVEQYARECDLITEGFYTHRCVEVDVAELKPLAKTRGQAVAEEKAS